MGDPVPTGPSWATRAVGAIQVIGGGIEVALGVGGIVLPEPATTVGGVILVAHGGDTVIAGFRTLWSGEVTRSLTQSGAEATAGALGASPETARYIGTGVDIAAGVGPSLAIGVTRRLAIAGAEKATTKVAVAYLPRRALQMGHNAVGVTDDSKTVWVHFLGTPTGSVAPMAGGPGARYVVTQLSVTAQQAARATAAQRALMNAGTQTWGYLGPNCTTAALRVLNQAGVVMPAWSRTPFLLNLGVRAGAEITVVGGAAATTAPAFADKPVFPQMQPR